MNEKQQAENCPICQGPAKVLPNGKGQGVLYYVECSKKKPCVFSLLYPTVEQALRVWDTRVEKKVSTGLPSGLL